MIRIATNIVLDGGLAAVAVLVARWLADPSGPVNGAWWIAPVGAATLLLAGLPFRLSLQYWRYAAMADLLAVSASAIGAAALFALAGAFLGSASGNPAFPVVHALTLLLFLGTPRVIYLRLRNRAAPASSQAEATTALLIGNADDADLFLRALARDRRQGIRVDGIVTPGKGQVGRRIQGQPILCDIDDLAPLLDGARSRNALPLLLIIVTQDLAGHRLAAVVAQAEKFGIEARRAPRPTALDAAERRGAVDLKPVAIEDLLNRPQVPLDRDGMARLIQGRRVMVTGAGGTIGSELARQVAAFGPTTLILLDNGEYALWQIDLELAETHPHVPRQTLIADIRDAGRVRAVFDTYRPELVFHAAALKHVPMVEANPAEGLLTNAVGTRHVADSARAVGALAMVLISTDKAVNPTSVMGASKRLAEMYCQALDIAARAHGQGMRCITVRFGNVLGSTGSVVPLFQRQLAKGGPLTVTHPDMRRYFMTVREAVGLVLQASVLGVGDVDLPAGRDGGIFVLDMGEPVKIVDLARQIIRLAGLRPETDIEIRFTGLRPGEKLYEELFHGKEPPAATGYAGLLMAAPRTADQAMVGRALDSIADLCRSGREDQALAALSTMVPEFERDMDAVPPIAALTRS
jgi:O-antigen biosynthesis protein WbqV